MEQPAPGTFWNEFDVHRPLTLAQFSPGRAPRSGGRQRSSTTRRLTFNVGVNSPEATVNPGGHRATTPTRPLPQLPS